MRHAIYLHIVWTTRDRQPLICHARACFLRRYLRNIAREERAHVLAVGMVSTHLHLLLRIHPACNLSRLLQRWKGGSTFLCRRDGIGDTSLPLRWARGCSVTSVGARALAVVHQYLMAQPDRHPQERIVGPDVAGESPAD